MADVNIDRIYVDNISVKEFAKENLVEKYFPDIEISDRTVGELGYITDILSNSSQDTFNTISVLFREMFANRAEIPESIYSHAAVFQLSNIFSKAASGSFILVLQESEILENIETDSRLYDTSTGLYYLYIDKSSLIYIEDIPYTIDYDVRINVAKKRDGTYLYTANYMIDTLDPLGINTEKYTNSISDIANPYIKVRRSSNGYIALELICHQCTKEIVEDVILENSTINYSVIDVPFSGKLAGFDIMYRAPGEDNYTQLETRIAYSTPTTEPFCYYQLHDENTLRIIFNSRDNYFQPEFNSDIKIYTYITLGNDGNFDSYTGVNYSVVPNNELYNYNSNFIAATQIIGSSAGGIDQIDLEALQNLTVEMYRTATVLATDNDLTEYFNNYKYRFGNSHIKFIKKRDDVAERVFSAFILMQNNEYIYNTNTLKLRLNVDDLINIEGNYYILEPGYLFTANDDNNRDYCEFYLNSYMHNYLYNGYRKSLSTLATDDEDEYIPYLQDANLREIAPTYLKNRPVSYAGWKQRHRKYPAGSYVRDDKGNLNYYEDKLRIYDIVNGDINGTTVSELDNPSDGKYLLFNPFLIKFCTSPNIVSTYLTYINNNCILDYYSSNYSDISQVSSTNVSYVQFIANSINIVRTFTDDKKYSITIKITPSIALSDDHPPVYPVKDEDYTNTSYVLNDRSRLHLNDLRVIFTITDFNGEDEICYSELYPTAYDESTNVFTYTGEIYTDDTITSNNKLKFIPDTKYRSDTYIRKTDMEPNTFRVVSDDISHMEYNPYSEITESDLAKRWIGEGSVPSVDSYVAFENGDYYGPDTSSTFDPILSDYTKYIHYNTDGSRVKTSSGEYEPPVDRSVVVEKLNYRPYSNMINMTEDDRILTPISDCVCNIYMLYRRSYYVEDEEGTTSVAVGSNGTLAINSKPATGEVYNQFTKFDSSLELYKPVDVYKTALHPVDFIKPLDSVRTYCKYEDYTEYSEVANVKEYTYDVMDMQFYNLPLIRASLFNALDEDGNSRIDDFMTKFYAEYKFLEDIVDNAIRNITNFDVKFYNTYGSSRTFTIGEDGESLDTVNIIMSFDVWWITATDIDTKTLELKGYIKSWVETINSEGTNSLYISNLIQDIENEFPEVDHLRFNSINNKDSSYQTVKITDSVDDLTTDERRYYVPEMLTCNINDITIINHEM